MELSSKVVLRECGNRDAKWWLLFMVIVVKNDSRSNSVLLPGKFQFVDQSAVGCLELSRMRGLGHTNSSGEIVLPMSRILGQALADMSETS